MLHILLLILKIIGIIIAVILGILVLLLCIVLFVPVRYEVKASFDGKITTAKAVAEVTWLARLLGVKVQYKDGSPHFRARIAWKTLKASGDSKDEPEKQEKSEKQETAVLDKAASEDRKEEKGRLKVDEKESEHEKKVKESTEDEKKISEKVLEERKNVPQKVEKSEKELEKEHEESEGEPGKKRLGIMEKLQNIYHKIISTKKAFCDKIKALSGKIKELTGKKEKVMSFLQNEDHKKAWVKAKKELWKLLKRLWPKCLKADIRYGFEDPSITGKILAGFSMIYPFVGENVHVYPDFEQSVIEGKLYIKGKIRVVTFIRTAWNLFWCKAVRKTYHDIREFEL